MNRHLPPASRQDERNDSYRRRLSEALGGLEGENRPVHQLERATTGCEASSQRRERKARAEGHNRESHAAAEGVRCRCRGIFAEGAIGVRRA